MALQEDHDLFDGFLRGPGVLDHPNPLLADTRNLDETFSMYFDDLEGL